MQKAYFYITGECLMALKILPPSKQIGMDQGSTVQSMKSSNLA